LRNFSDFLRILNDIIEFMATQIKLRRGTAAQWTASNPTISQGEAGFEVDTNKLKIGDGTTAWVDLDYIYSPPAPVDLDPYLTIATASATYLTQSNATSSYQPLDADLTSIAAISGSTGFLKTDGSGSWSVDTATYQTVVANISDTEIGYLNNASANIQDQLNSKTDKLLQIYGTYSSNYTFQMGDEDKLHELSGTLTVTVPPESTYNFPIGTQINILNIGSGTITAAGGSGVTLNGTPGLKLRAQWSSATIIKRASNTWVIVGDLAA
jgi:hypothetical protein